MASTRKGPVPAIPVAAGTRIHLPKTFERLYDLAYNMWWVWQYRARDLWQRVSPATSTG